MPRCHIIRYDGDTMGKRISDGGPLVVERLAWRKFRLYNCIGHKRYIENSKSPNKPQISSCIHVCSRYAIYVRTVRYITSPGQQRAMQGRYIIMIYDLFFR